MHVLPPHVVGSRAKSPKNNLQPTSETEPARPGQRPAHRRHVAFDVTCKVYKSRQQHGQPCSSITGLRGSTAARGLTPAADMQRKPCSNNERGPLALAVTERCQDVPGWPAPSAAPTTRDEVYAGNAMPCDRITAWIFGDGATLSSLQEMNASRDHQREHTHELANDASLRTQKQLLHQ
jgi:hypothetical protein